MSFLRRIRSKEDLILIAILIIGLVVKFGYLMYYRSLPDWDQLSVDNYYHHHLAQSIAGGNVIGDTTYFRAPLYIYCLGALYALFGDSLWVGRLFGLAVGLASVLMTYLLAEKVFDRRTGLIAAAIQIICPILIYYDGELLLDSFFCFLIQLCLYRFLRWKEHATNRNALWMGMTLGLAAIARPTALALVPVAVVFIYWLLKDKRVVARQLIFLAIGLAALIGPIFVRNLAVAGDPVLIASQGGINFYIGNNPSADGLSAILPEPLGFNWRIADISAIAEQAAGRDLKPGEVSSYWTDQTWKWIWNDPEDALRLFGRKLYFTFSDKEISNNKDLEAVFGVLPFFRYNPLTFAPILGLAMVGLCVSIRRNFSVQLLALSILAIMLLNAVFFINSRFRLPILVLLIVLAASGLWSVVAHTRARRWRAAGLLAGGAIVIATLSHADLVRLPRGTGAQWLNSQMLYYFGIHDDRKALEFGRRAVAVEATFPEANLNVGNVWLREGVTDSAKYYYRRETLANPKRSKAYINLASIYLLNGEYDSSSALISKALALRPRDPTANALIIRLASTIQLPADSLQRVIDSAVKRSRQELRVLAEAGSALVQHDLIPAAEPYLMQAVAAHPPPIEMDDAAFDQDFADSPEKFSRRKATSFYLLGYIRGRDNRFEEAVRFSRLALACDSNQIGAWVNLVSGYLALDRLAEADSSLATAMIRFPEDQRLQRLSAATEKMKRDR